MMKTLGTRLCTLLTTWFVVSSLCAQPDGYTVEARNLVVTLNKTTSVIFPAAILSVDRGSRDILTQKAKGVENILQLKATREEFPETNLTVITTDGNIHQFTVNYAQRPHQLIVNATFQNRNTVELPIIYGKMHTDNELDAIAAYIKAQQKKTRNAQRKHKMSMALHGFFIYQDMLLAWISLENKSHIPYDADYLRLYLSDKKKVKRTASQELEVTPVKIMGECNHIPAQSKQDVIFVLTKFTIPDDRRLVAELFEKNGGRNLKIQIKYKTIVKSQPVQLTP